MVDNLPSKGKRAGAKIQIWNSGVPQRDCRFPRLITEWDIDRETSSRRGEYFGVKASLNFQSDSCLAIIKNSQNTCTTNIFSVPIRFVPLSPTENWCWNSWYPTLWTKATLLIPRLYDVCGRNAGLVDRHSIFVVPNNILTFCWFTLFVLSLSVVTRSSVGVLVVFI